MFNLKKETNIKLFMLNITVKAEQIEQYLCSTKYTLQQCRQNIGIL